MSQRSSRSSPLLDLPKSKIPVLEPSYLHFDPEDLEILPKKVEHPYFTDPQPLPTYFLDDTGDSKDTDFLHQSSKGYRGVAPGPDLDFSFVNYSPLNIGEQRASTLSQIDLIDDKVNEILLNSMNFPTRYMEETRLRSRSRSSSHEFERVSQSPSPRLHRRHSDRRNKSKGKFSPARESPLRRENATKKAQPSPEILPSLNPHKKPVSRSQSRSVSRQGSKENVIIVKPSPSSPSRAPQSTPSRNNSKKSTSSNKTNSPSLGTDASKEATRVGATPSKKPQVSLRSSPSRSPAKTKKKAAVDAVGRSQDGKPLSLPSTDKPSPEAAGVPNSTKTSKPSDNPPPTLVQKSESKTAPVSDKEAVTTAKDSTKNATGPAKESVQKTSTSKPVGDKPSKPETVSSSTLPKTEQPQVEKVVSKPAPTGGMTKTEKVVAVGAATGAAVAGTSAAVVSSKTGVPSKKTLQPPNATKDSLPEKDVGMLAEEEKEKKRQEEEEETRLRESSPAFKLLTFCAKGDWPSVEVELRFLERSIQAGTIQDVLPLSTISDANGWTPLMFAVKDNKTVLGEQMIDLGSDVNQRNKETMTPIHIAALHGKDETIRWLITKKADVAAVTEDKKLNLVHLACSRTGAKNNILRGVLAITPNEARLQKSLDGNIPLFTAMATGSRWAVSELLTSLTADQIKSHGGPPHKDTPLHVAVRKRDLELARIFVDAKANVDAKNGQWQTPLILAAEAGDENLVKFFYLCKANPNVADKEDHTALYHAAKNGHTQIIELLSEKFKVSVFERTKDGSTLMHIASLHGHPETAMALFRKGVPLQMPNKGGARSLHIAAQHGHATMISKLLEKGERVDAVTNENYTALHIAVEQGRVNVVETLLGHGAQVHVKGGKAKETPLHIAARVDQGEKCAQMLLKSGADSNNTMENGETPLHVAARHGRVRIIRLLLQDGGDLQKTSKDGETPLHLACRHGHYRVVKELLQYIKRDKGEADMNLYINHITTKGESSLHYAAQLRKDDPDLMAPTSISSPATAADKEKESHPGKYIAKMLLDGGASVYKATKEGSETPFHYCAREGNNDILLEMLSRMTQVECQRAVNKPSAKGWSPLLIACHQGHTDVVKTLLENHARVDVFDNEGRSALHLAAENGSQEICGILLKHKAFINAKSRVGFTALHLAATKGFTKLCLNLIQEHGASVDALTLKKQTPMHLAAEAGQLEVCRLLMGLRASPDAADEKGQKPIHLAAQNNHSDVIKLFLKHQNSLVTSATRDGSTCAHLAAMQGSVAVLEELMKFDKQGVISVRIRSTDSTVLQLAAEGGHAELVKSLIDAGATPSDENTAGYAAIMLAAKNGHTGVLDALKGHEDAIKLTSRKHGLTAMHIAAYYGQTEMVRELLPYISASTPSQPPLTTMTAFIKELGTESGLTPLHMASFSGEENVVRLLLNSQGVQVDAPTTNLGFNPLHLACRGGHTTVVSLLLSRSSDLLESRDASGKSSLHIAAIHGHIEMVELLLGQGSEIDAIDKELWTPLICASKAGHLEVVKLLVERAASPLASTSKGHSAIWFASAENHIPVLSYLLKQEHDTYALMDDKEFVYNITVCGKNNDNEPIDEFVLSSSAPVDVAAKLSNILINLSTREKERAKDLVHTSKHCEAMAAELLAISSAAESTGKILESVDRKGVEFLDVLIENEQKEVIAHTVVQRYLAELWVGSLNKWGNWKLLLLFFSFIICPPIWIIFSLPLGHRFYKIPIIKFMSYLTSHIHLMILLCLTSVTPIYPVLPIRTNLFPFWFEWLLLAWLTGLIISEVSNPSDKSGLGWIKVAVLVFSILAVILHVVGCFLDSKDYGTLLYLRNQLFGMAVLLACVQILDFLSFHQLFGPWAIIIGDLMKDLARFLAVLVIFMVGFSLVMAGLNSPIHARKEPPPNAGNQDDQNHPAKTLTNGLPSGVKVTPIDSFEILFFALFGLHQTDNLKIETQGQPDWTLIFFKVFFGIYMLVTVVVLINLLIAMMSDTYQRIQAQSDIEWKFGLAKLIRSMHRTSATASPINLFTSWFMWIFAKCKERKGKKGGWNIMKRKTGKTSSKVVPVEKSNAKQQWRAVLKKTQSTKTPRASDIMRLGVGQGASGLNVFGSALSIGNKQRIETVTDWPMISRKYKILVGKIELHPSATEDSEGQPIPQGQGPQTPGIKQQV